MVARTLGGDRIIAKVLWPASLTYLGTASEGDPVSKQNGGLEVGRLSQSCIGRMIWRVSKLSTAQL